MTLPELRLFPGQTAALYGPSGCGKTSMLMSIFGLLEREGWRGQGEVQFRDRSLHELAGSDLLKLRRKEVAFLMQDAHNALDPLVRVGEQVFAATGAATDPARLRELVDSGSALLLATHDHRLLRDLNADIYALQDGAFLRAEPDQLPRPPRPKEDVGSVPVLEAKQVSVACGDRKVLDNVDFVLRRGEITAPLGESGAGKTTLLRVLAGHRPPDSGLVERPDRKSAVQLVCQDALAPLTPGRRLHSLLNEASAPSFDAFAGARSVQLPERLLMRSAEQMSGGEHRRDALLRSIAVQPEVLLQDEPTASLDRAAAVAVIDNLLTMQRNLAVAIVVATHDESLAAAIAHRQLTVREGQLCE